MGRSSVCNRDFFRLQWDVPTSEIGLFGFVDESKSSFVPRSGTEILNALR